MKNRLYIAYGSNLNMKQMARRCPGAKVVAKSWIHDHRLVFQGMAFGAHANIIPEEGYDVPVAIWEITARDEWELDRYEGVAGGYYTKETMEVEVAGKIKKALVYIMTPHFYGIPSDAYLKCIAEGYRDFNLDIRILNEAIQSAYKNTRSAAAPAAL